MFTPRTQKIKEIYSQITEPVNQLNNLLRGNVGVYIDYANVRPWAVKLGWNIDPKRLKQFLDSFGNIRVVRFYDGTLLGDKFSEKHSCELLKIFQGGFKTKPVKILRQSINYTSIKSNSTDLLEKFIRKCLLLNYDLKTIEFLNEKFKEMNQKGIFYIEDRKCNFDVEIGRDMLLDFEKNEIDTFSLWSGDSDFYDPISQLLADSRRVVLFATAGKIAKELNDLTTRGLIISDIKKIREFICWKKQI